MAKTKYERAIIATYNEITTQDFNGDTPLDDLLKREKHKPRPQRLPKNPLVLAAITAEPQGGMANNPVVQRLAEMEGGTIVNTGFVLDVDKARLDPPDFEAPKIDIVGGPTAPRSLLDKKAYEFLQVLAVAAREAKGIGKEQQKPEFGGDRFVVGHSKSEQQVFGFDGYQKSPKGQPNIVQMDAHPDTVVAMLHLHPPVQKGVWKEVDCENRDLSPPDKKAMKDLIKDVRPAQKLGYRADTKIYAYLGTPDGQIRRFDPDDGWVNGVTLWPSGTLSYYKDFLAYDAETLKGCKR